MLTTLHQNEYYKKKRKKFYLKENYKLRIIQNKSR